MGWMAGWVELGGSEDKKQKPSNRIQSSWLDDDLLDF